MGETTIQNRYQKANTLAKDYQKTLEEVKEGEELVPIDLRGVKEDPVYSARKTIIQGRYATETIPVKRG